MPSKPSSTGIPEPIQRLINRVRAGEKTRASAQLYLAEYDRLHGTSYLTSLPLLLTSAPPEAGAGGAPQPSPHKPRKNRKPK